jgi:hypothetical protein
VIVGTVFDWLYECTRSYKPGQKCAYPNTLVLFVPAGLVFLFAYARWNLRIRQGRPTGPYFSKPMLVVMFGSLGLALVVTLAGP